MLPGSHVWGDQINECQGRGSTLATIPDGPEPSAEVLAQSRARNGGAAIKHRAFSVDGFGDVDLDGFEPAVAAPPVGPARPCPVKRGEVHFHHSLTWCAKPIRTLHASAC